MKKLLAFIVISCLLSGIADAKLIVITTTADLASLVKEVGGDRVQVSSLITGARDPHRIEAKPSYMSKAAGANLWVAIGLELEIGYEPPILEGSGNSKIRVGAAGHVYAGEWVKVLGKSTSQVTRAQGDIHPYGNPHIWLDPYNGRVIARKLADRMGSLDKGSATFYDGNAENFVKRLDIAMFGAALVGKFGGEQLWAWDNSGDLSATLRSKNALGDLGGWAGKMLRYRGQPVVTYHRSWAYFLSRFDLKVVAELEPKPGLDPSPGHVASVIRTVQSNNVKAIIQEPYYSTKNGQFVAERASSNLVVLPGSVGHDPAAKDYISLFDTIVSRLTAAFAR
jgi:ABC-type Zn uptake system ZnuABC Zn-binding protein ZnuA